MPRWYKNVLTGKAALKENEEQQNAPVELQKFMTPVFRDEWDYVIDNYISGANEPGLIDSIGKLAYTRPVSLPVTEKPKREPSREDLTLRSKRQVFTPAPDEPSVKTTSEPAPKRVVISAPPTNEQRLKTRSRQLVQEITVTGDSLELNFYDNAEIDGDSIAVF